MMERNTVMRQSCLLFTLALLGSLSLCTPAQALVGEFYLGGGVGRATLEDEFTADDFKEDDTAFKAFTGYRLTLLPVLDFAVEAGYRDLGDPGDTVAGQSIDAGLTGYDLAGLVITSIGPVDLFLKAGGMNYDYELEFSGAGEDRDYDGTAALYGAGVGVRFWKLGARVEYEYIDVDELERSSTYWLSLYLRF